VNQFAKRLRIGASDDEDSVGGLPSDDELYNVGKVRFVKGGNLSESSDDV